MDPAAVLAAAITALMLIGAGRVLARRSRRPPAEPSPARPEEKREVVTIALGGSILEAQVIEQRLKAQGFTVSLLKHEHPETGGFSALGHSALLVLRAEEQRVREELEALGY